MIERVNHAGFAAPALCKKAVGGGWLIFLFKVCRFVGAYLTAEQVFCCFMDAGTEQRKPGFMAPPHSNARVRSDQEQRPNIAPDTANAGSGAFAVGGAVPGTGAGMAGCAPGQAQLPAAIKTHRAFLAGQSGGQQLTLDAQRFAKVNLRKLDLRDARMVGSHMPGVHLDDADLSFSNLFGATFSHGSLVRCNFTRCDLRGVHLDYADAEEAVFRYADLRDGFIMMRDADGVLCVADSVMSGLENLINSPSKDDDGDCGEDHDAFSPWHSRLLVKGHTSLKYANLAGADLTGSNLSGADLRGVNFAGANLTDANFQGCVLHGASLAGAVIDNTNFAKADFRGCDVRGRDLVYANCPSVKTNKTFDGREEALAEMLRDHETWRASKGRKGVILDLDGYDLSDRSFSGLRFSCGSLRFVRFLDAKFKGGSFARANLQWSVFRDAELVDVDFRGADLSKSVLCGAVFRDCAFDPHPSLKPGGQDRSARLSFANMQGAVFENCTFNRVDFTRARLAGAEFRNCTFDQANFKGATLKGANGADAQFVGVIPEIA